MSLTKREIKLTTEDDKLDLSVAIYDVEKAKGIVQIVHGALEFKERYEKFCRFLQSKGYAVIASDNRGHGQSVNGNYEEGFMYGYEELIEDQHMLAEYIKKEYPGKTLTMLGHSFGSMLARIYIQKYDDTIDKLILTGTPRYVPGVNLAIDVTRNMLVDEEDPFLTSKFYDRVTDLPLIQNRVSDRIGAEQFEAFKNSPNFVRSYPSVSHLTLYEANSQMNVVQDFQLNNPDLRILIAVGTLDDLVGEREGLASTAGTLQKAGYEDIVIQIYEEQPHEILTAVDSEVIFHDMLQFIEG